MSATHFDPESHPDADAHPLLAALNEDQRRAVLAFGRPVLILAGAGSGKTRAITHKIAWLVEEERIPSWRILAMTFTNKAAREMRERVESLLGGAAMRDAWVGTFHSSCLRILRAEANHLGYLTGFVVYDDQDQLTLLGRVVKQANIGEKAGTPRQFQRYIDSAKNQGYGPDDPRLPVDDPFSRTASQIYRQYQDRLRAANAMDFGDLIRLVVVLFDQHPAVLQRYRERWQYVVVDEFQDTNSVQYKILKQLTDGRNNLCVVGDDDQSIYSWRGARIENILQFPTDFPDTEVVRLERNYRSTANILAAAGAVISRNADRHPKTMWTDREDGSVLELYVASTDRIEAERLATEIRRLRSEYSLAEMAIIYRTNAMSRVIEDALRGYNVPYRMVGGLRFYDRAEVKDLLSYMKLLVNPADEVALSRIINVPARKIGSTSVARVLDHAQRTGLAPLHAVYQLAQGSDALAKKLQPFAELYRRLEAMASHSNVVEVAVRVQEWSGYQRMLQDDPKIEAEKKRENLSELLASMEEYVEAHGDEATVQSYLDQVALASNVDAEGGTEPSVTLMTVHSAKGLEFDVVFLAGLEEGLLPHFNSMDDPSGVAEERRLCYVAMTRARSLLHLSWAQQRRKFGGISESARSRFLRDVPAELMHVTNPSMARREQWQSEGFTGRPGASSWGRRTPHAPEPVPPPPTDGIVVDTTYDQSSDTPGPGMRVTHPKFGVGTILAIRGEGPDAKVTVRFSSIGEKTLVARFLARAM